MLKTWGLHAVYCGSELLRLDLKSGLKFRMQQSQRVVLGVPVLGLVHVSGLVPLVIVQALESLPEF